MNTIIVATDYSPEAENAMNYAIDAAKANHYRIVLFNLFTPSVHSLNARSSNETINSIAHSHQHKLNMLANKVQREDGIETIAYLATGELNEEIEKCVQEFEGNMVIIGMPTKSLEQDLLGNTTTKMLHINKIPTLAIPLTAKYHGIKNILFACDMNRGIQKIILQRVIAIAKEFNAQVELFYVSERLNALNTEKGHKTLSEINTHHNNEVRFLYKNVASDEVIEAIHKEIETYNADVLIMVPYKYGFWGSMVHRSKTRSMASGNKIPLLSIPL